MSKDILVDISLFGYIYLFIILILYLKILLSIFLYWYIIFQTVIIFNNQRPREVKLSITEHRSLPNFAPTDTTLGRQINIESCSEFTSQTTWLRSLSLIASISSGKNGVTACSLNPSAYV